MSKPSSRCLLKNLCIFGVWDIALLMLKWRSRLRGYDTQTTKKRWCILSQKCRFTASWDEVSL
jgi:hypothetical protein